MCARPSSARTRARSARSRWPCRLSNSPDQHSRAVTGQGVARLEQEAFAGNRNVASRADLAVQRDDPPSAVLQNIPRRMDQREKGPADKRAFLTGGRMLLQRFWVRRWPRNRDGVLEVKLARASVIVKSVGHVRILLELEQRDPAADRMDGARRDEVEIAGLDGAPGHKAFDRSVECGATEILAGDLALQTKAKRRAGLGLEDEPALTLAAWQS